MRKTGPETALFLAGGLRKMRCISHKRKKQKLLPVKDGNIKFNVSLPSVLSEKEKQLLKALLKGYSLTTIARARNRSIKTLYSQKYSLYEKLGIRNDILLYRDLIVRGFIRIEKDSPTTVGLNIDVETTICYADKQYVEQVD